jgi:hypothetical protein
MEAFSNMGNHLVSNSAAAINASDDTSTVDPDESVLSLAKGPRRRQHDDDESESIEEDDLESLASAAVDANGKKQIQNTEEVKELPAHACAYEFFESYLPGRNTANALAVIAAFTTPAASSDASRAPNGSAPLAAILPPRTLSTTSFELDTKKFNYTPAVPWAIRSSNATIVAPRMSSCSVSFLQNQTLSSFCFADSRAPQCIPPRT